MDSYNQSNHTLFFALGAFALILMLGSQADISEMQVAAVGSTFTGPTEKVILPLQSALTGGEWQSVGNPDMVSAISETSCDGNASYIAPKYYAITDATFTVSLNSIPDGAKITSLSVTPCIASIGGSATSDVAVTFNFPGETFMLQPVQGTGSPYILNPGGGNTPVPAKTSVFSLPSIVKNPDSMLTVGLSPIRNGGGIRVSGLAVSAEYVPPGAPESVEQKPFSAVLDWSQDSSNLLYLDALLTWDAATAKQGGQIEVARMNQNGQIVGVWSMVGVVSEGENILRYPLVIGGVPRDDYTSGLSYAFRIRKDGVGNLISYSDVELVTPPENLRVEAPRDFKAVINSTAHKVDLSWVDQAASDQDHFFLVDRAILANTLDWNAIGNTASYATSWSDSSLTAIGNYFYRVRTAKTLPDYNNSIVVSDYSEITGILLNDVW